MGDKLISEALKDANDKFVAEYKEATPGGVFRQCADNYEKANEELPKRLNPKMIARR